MEENEKQIKDSRLWQTLIVAGNISIVIGSSLCGCGTIIRLLNQNRLPEHPLAPTSFGNDVVGPQILPQKSLAHSYFNL